MRCPIATVAACVLFPGCALPEPIANSIGHRGYAVLLP
jgi:hypothetical protein